MSKLNYNDEILAKEVAKTKDLTQAAMNILEFDNRELAASFMRGKLRSSQFRNRIDELLDKQGLTIFKANSKLKQLLEAKKEVVCGDKVIKQEDYIIQSKALEILYKLHKQLGNISAETINQTNVLITNQDLTSLNKSLEAFKSLQDQLSQGKPIGEVIDIDPQIRGVKT
jgi:23S rRNA-/tRNA-specific pseudouridylate synthase